MLSECMKFVQKNISMFPFCNAQEMLVLNAFSCQRLQLQKILMQNFSRWSVFLETECTTYKVLFVNSYKTFVVRGLIF